VQTCPPKPGEVQALADSAPLVAIRQFCKGAERRRHRPVVLVHGCFAARDFMKEYVTMNTRKVMITFAAVALMVGTGGAFAQQDPAHGKMDEKLAPKATDHLDHRDTNLTFDTTPDDHARLREIFGKDRSARRIEHVRFSLSVGTVVPSSVRLVALPQTITDIQPSWRGNEFFRVGRQILIVDPHSKEIVSALSV